MTGKPLGAPSVLITGGYGCIGAETAKWLIRHTDSNVIVCQSSVLFLPARSRCMGSGRPTRVVAYRCSWNRNRSMFTLPSHTIDTGVIVDAMRLAAEELQIAGQFNITVGSEEVPFICDLEYQPFLDAFPRVPQTALHQAVRQSIQTFLDQARRGELSTA